MKIYIYLLNLRILKKLFIYNLNYILKYLEIFIIRKNFFQIYKFNFFTNKIKFLYNIN